ncbi:site-specific integrase [Ligilactobacillus ruminis]|uniref:site-specific integrase n=1 Tax=Ligilactobacillus ruminis TaxID=1623 RepID=UPI00232D3366|nr:site-specific integrase [Ligilactobacillus ruminis]MDB7641085.1 site-specific integrase [Ligilactobacillus ruminis]MDB7646269.1 site-specific integrase [Ligilactobacillus ruminis]MDB7648212.1 site-specific integrase [Ligilactobacillus ruminis]
MLLSDYFAKEIETYKKDQVREQTYGKYLSNCRFVADNWPGLSLEKMTADDYQQILNRYAETHEKATTTDFHHQLAWALKRAYNVDGILKRDVTFDAKIPLGKKPSKKKQKFMEIEDMKKLIQELKHENTPEANFFLILLKTGLRFAEALGITLNDIDFEKKTVSINKTLNYKGRQKGTRTFAPTKNKYSVRTIIVDDAVLYMLWKNAKGADPDESIFFRLKGFQFNSTLNNKLKRACRKAGVPEITLHSLRHEHATYLVSQGISSMAVAERLGHADDSVTRAVYIHRLETEKARDNEEIAQKIASL